MNLFQNKLLEMIKWFHQLCKENHLRYYAIDGTMLGTMRHHGFIPWDDDIDVGMPRQDYRKLEELMKQNTNGRYILETPNTEAKEYCYPYSKLYDTTTTLVENQKYKIKRGLYIDVFPLDGFGTTLEEAKQIFKRIDRKRNLLLAKTSGIRKGRSLYKNISIVLTRIVPINERKLLKEVSESGDVCDFDNAIYGGNTFSAWKLREVMPISYYGKPTLYRFENIEIYGVEQADKYLEQIYGDWRKLPPIEKRVSHHDFIYCDLEKSWLS